MDGRGATDPTTNRRSTALAMAAVAVVTFAVGVVALDARATYGARTTADEPQYLTTALSLAEDFDLDISDELEERAFEPYHEISLNPQTIDLTDDGQRISPHDPLLPLLLAAPMGIGGWQLAKAALALIAALTGALTTGFAIDRLPVRPSTAGLVVGAFFVSPPMTAYATQVYPEMPAATCVIAAVWALSRPSSRRNTWVVLVCTVALPWLSVKYVPVTAVLAVALLLRDRDRRRQLEHVAVWAVAGAIYLIVHQRIYGGWTVYASGDHFVDGEFLVVGNDPDYVGRTRRLVGLLVDRGFGLIAWTPAFLAAVPAMVGLIARRHRDRLVMTSVVVAGWGVATWVALTMHGWWWPGRQVVVILPVVIAAVALMVERSKRLVAATVAGGVIGCLSWLWLVTEASTDRRTLIVDFHDTANPWYRLWRHLLPDHTRMNAFDVVLTVVWTIVLAGLGLWAWRRSAPSSLETTRDHSQGVEWQRS